jgi:predicted amidohydrolase
LRERIPMDKSSVKIVEYGEPGKGRSFAVASMRVEYDKRKNLAKYQRFIKAAKERKADLLVFPEMSLQGYLWADEPCWCLPRDTANYHWKEAETIPGPATDAVGKLAKQFNMHIVFGMARRAFHGGHGVEMLYNSAVLVGPKGIVGVQDKLHNPGGEKHIFKGGKSIDVFQTSFGKVGMMVCWDVGFPECARVLALKGADILVLSTAWGTGATVKLKDRVVKDFGHLAYQSFIRTRALENHAWMLSSNWVGEDKKSGASFVGGSAVINPLGLTLAEVSHEEGLAVAHGLDISEERLAAKTEHLFGNNVFLDRRPELYGSIADRD